MIAIISDVHANYDALQAVLAEIDNVKAEAILCLGDMVGYGPEPVKCVDEVRRRCDVTLCGNHDYALVYGAEAFSPLARTSIESQRKLMMPSAAQGQADEDRRERWEFLKGLSYRHVRGATLFVHAAPRNPVTEYLRRIDVILGMREKLTENFQQMDWLCFIGHTHRPGVITGEMKFYKPDEIDDVFRPKPRHKAIINVGSVGQPRDGDWRACFVTLEDDGAIHYHRVEYDIDSVVAKIAAAEGMDGSLTDRLRRGR